MANLCPCHWHDCEHEPAERATNEALAEALGRVLDRMGTKTETLDQAIEAVYPDYGGLNFAEQLRSYAQGRNSR